MLRFVAAHVRHGRGRSLVVAIGVLVAAVGFTLLTSEANTSALAVQGTVARNWRPAYDIVVRPPEASTAFEQRRGLVRTNSLSGIFGGITLDEWHVIQSIRDVEVAAPVANIGYFLPADRTLVPVSRYLTDAPFELFRVHGFRSANNGLSRYPVPVSYVYITKNHVFRVADGDVQEVIPGRGNLPVCAGYRQAHSTAFGPFDQQAQSALVCLSLRSPALAAHLYGPAFAEEPGGLVEDDLPVLLTAIDPEQEARLVNLPEAIVSGRALNEGEVPGSGRNPDSPDARTIQVPVIASTRSNLDETLDVTIERLQPPPGVDVQDVLATGSAREFLAGLRGVEVGTARISMQSAYDDVLDRASEETGLGAYESYRTVSGVRYRTLAGGRLEPVTMPLDLNVWTSQRDIFLRPPRENADVQFRTTTAHPAIGSFANHLDSTPWLKVVGRFDPGRLTAATSAAGVPLETYFPPLVTGADDASRAALGDRPMLPTMNLGGYLAQPPMMLTTLTAIGSFFEQTSFKGVDATAPIGAIRVRVAGVEGPDPVSRERIRLVAQAINARTGLLVDITAGSSATPVTVQLPAGDFGQPALLVREQWVRKGVAVHILRALDRKSLAVFLLVLLVTSLFVVNATVAGVRARRTEIGALQALGWSRGHVFRAVLGENALLGLVSGAAGTLLGAALAGLVLHQRTPILHSLFITPVAVALAVVGGLVPAWIAARATPLDAVRPRAPDRHRALAIRTMGRLAWANLRRAGTRTLLGVIAVGVGVAGSTFLVSVGLSFQGSLVGSALGRLVSVQVRDVDLVGVGLVVALAAFLVGDVLALNMRERAPELVTLRATGWRTRDLRRLVMMEGGIVGLLGSLGGVVLGTAIVTVVGGHVADVALVGFAELIGGTIVVMLASALPAIRVSRFSPPLVLSEE